MKKRVIVGLSIPIDELAKTYVGNINRKLKQKKLPSMTKEDILGAVLTYFLLSNKDYLLRVRDELEYEEVRSQLHKYLSPTELAIVGIASKDANLRGTGGSRSDSSGTGSP